MKPEFCAFPRDARSGTVHPRRYRFVMFLPVLLMLCVASAPAQERTLMIGAGGGYETGRQTTALPVFPGSTACGEFTSGPVSSFWLGGTVVFPSLFDDRLGAAIQLGWSSRSGHVATSTVDTLWSTVKSSQGEGSEPISIPHQFQLRSAIQMIQLGLGARYNLFERFDVRLGAWLGYQISSSFSPIDKVIGDGEGRFEGGADEVPLADATVPTASALMFGGVLTASYELPLGSRVSLLPELSLRADLGSSIQETGWRALTLGGGATLLFDLTQRPESPPVAENPPADPQTLDTPAVSSPSAADPQSAIDSPTRPSTETTRPPRITAAIDLHSVDERGRRLSYATVRIYETLHRQRTPVLQSVYFDRGSAGLADRYVQYAPGHSIDLPADSLAALDPIAIQRHVLNRLGARLRERAGARVTLTGSISGEEPKSLARSRAETVRKYLEETWGIERSRIRIGERAVKRVRESSEDGRAENRRVVITVEGARLDEPIESENIERDYDPPLIKLNPTFEADEGVKHWTISVSHDGKEIARYAKDQQEGTSRSDLDWQVVDDGSEDRQSFLMAEMTVEDSTGARFTTRSQMPLVMERVVRLVDRVEERGTGQETIGYSLLAFDYNSTELSERNRGVVEEIADEIRSGARVIVTGFTDRTGGGGYNLALSKRRAEKTADYLRGLLRRRGVRNVTIVAEGRGIDEARFDNDVPEGRVLSRNVDVVVQQEIR